MNVSLVILIMIKLKKELKKTAPKKIRFEYLLLYMVFMCHLDQIRPHSNVRMCCVTQTKAMYKIIPGLSLQANLLAFGTKSNVGNGVNLYLKNLWTLQMLI